MTIRVAEEKDYIQVENLMKQVQNLHVELRPDIYKPEEVVLPKKEFMEQAKKEEILVAVEEKKVVGLLSYILRMISGKTVVEKKVLFIECLVVDEEYRGRGIGSRLLDCAKEIYREKKCNGLELQVNARNIGAWELYKKCGFRGKSINMELE